MKILVVLLALVLASPVSAQQIQMPVPCAPLAMKQTLQAKFSVKTIVEAKSARGGKMELWRAEDGKYFVVLIVSGRVCMLDAGSEFRVSNGA